MADTAIAITAGTGTNVDTRTEATNGNHRQVIVIGDPSTNAGVAPVDATTGLAVNVTNASLTVASHAVTNAGTFAVQATTIGGQSPAFGTGTASSATMRVVVASDQLASLGQAAMSASQPVVIASNQSGLANRAFSAAFSTLTRPANTTAYTALDSISDNATAGSVTALSATISDVNDDPVFISDILVTSTDTGLAGKRVRAYVFNSNPTSSSGVVNGDNAAYSQKVAGYIGSFSGVLETGFSDGTVGRLVPTYADGAAASTPHAMAGGFVVCLPTSGAKTLYIQYQAVDGFTPSANSTTIIGKARGWQGRAA